MVVKPYVAFVGRPLLVARPRMAWNARWNCPEPSMRYTVCAEAIRRRFWSGARRGVQPAARLG
jgi:hypothetical protein